MITKNEIASLNMSPTKKDFVQIWNELMEVASKITERWDPTSTNESDPGIVLLKVLAGIADKLNYNIDKNILEAYMPTAAQMESMHKLCELVGYDIKYYQSAETKVRISYTGNTTDLSDENEEKLPEPGGLALPKFTTITNADKDITFVTTNTIPMLLTNTTPWVEVPCIEGQVSQCESINADNLITRSQIDDNNRYYLPEIQIAENGIFVYNAVVNAGTLVDGTAWNQVSNLNTQPPESRVFKFGYDSFENRPYIAFPDDIGNLIGDGLFIYFIRTSGVNGNISPRTLEVLEVPADWEGYSAEQFEVVNVDATTNGANVESISTAYQNFKKTAGIFDTLVTCRDYMNKIYSLMDASNLPYVSNILVTDIRNDINNAITLCSCNEFGILYKETPLTKTVEKSDGSSSEVPSMDHFDLILYPFKTYAQVSSGTKDLVAPYNRSFTYTDQMDTEIAAALSDLKTCAHNFTAPEDGDLVAINNYLRLDALIATATRVSEIEAEDILKNVKVALVNEFNLRNLDFGEEIPFDSILSTIENADSRIKVVSLQEPTILTTYSVREKIDEITASKEYGIASTDRRLKRGVKGVAYGDDAKTAKGETAKDIYNKLVLRNILAGRASLFNYDETFVSNNSEKPYTVTKDLTDILAIHANVAEQGLGGDELVSTLHEELTTANLAESENELQKLLDTDIAEAIIEAIEALDLLVGEYVLKDDKGSIIKGFYNGVITVKVFKDSNNYRVYETYKHNFKPVSAQPATFMRTRAASFSTPTGDDIISDIKRVEAVCEITNNNGTFENITLKKNEVIKFRAPNLITTKTFPAYVYYHFKKNQSAEGNNQDPTASAGRYAEAMTLESFINKYTVNAFFNTLWELADKGVKSHEIEATSTDGTVVINQADELTDIFNKSIVVSINPKIHGEQSLYSNEGQLRTHLGTYFTDNNVENIKVTLSYYPLEHGTMATWSRCIKHFKSDLPGETVLWRLSQTSGYPKGRYVISTSQRLSAQSSDYLLNNYVGDITYICTDLGADPEYYTLSKDSDIELGSGDKLYIHYTPSSTNEDGETVNAEPISVVYEGGDENNPIILKPSGFTLMPSNEVNRQGTSWKKTVEFNGESVGLLALAPNEQIELRSLSRVVLNKSAMFYKNFDNEQLEHGDVNNIISYELKDGEYIFYTDQNTQEAAYYGSGSVITLTGGAYIPKTTEKVEVSQILEQGLHIIPWSLVLLNTNKTVTITEYQYITLVEGDTLNTVTIDAPDAYGKYTISSDREVRVDVEDEEDEERVREPWVKCKMYDQATGDLPIIYTPAGAESPTTLPKIVLSTGGWEVCSFLELSTSPGYSQPLRAVTVLPAVGADAEANATTITNKVKLYLDKGTGISAPIEVAPQKTAVVDSTGQSKTEFEPVSIKLDTIVQVASGSFEKAESDYDDSYVEDDDEIDDDTTVAANSSTMQMKIFKEEPVSLIALDSIDDVITPISDKFNVPADSSLTSINNNNTLTKIDIASKLFSISPGEAEKKPNALSLNCMIPDNTDVAGMLSVYVEVPESVLDTASTEQSQLFPREEFGVFIDIPAEFGNHEEVVSIFNNDDSWWEAGIDNTTPNRLYLKAGLNCITVKKSCSLLIKAEPQATGSIIYDNMRLVKGVDAKGINLALLDFKVTPEMLDPDPDPEGPVLSDDAVTANAILAGIKALDKNSEFYYTVPVENGLAIEFDNNRRSLSDPHTLYDINNINNSFVVSKLDVDYLDRGLKIAKSSKY